MPPAQIAATPSRIEMEIGGKPANSSVKLFNLSDQPVSVHTTVSHWDLDDENEVRVIAPTAQSLDQWMIINPIDFTIPAHSSQTVRLSVRPFVEPEPGEHRGIIYFEQKLADEDNTGIAVSFRLGIIVYGLAEPISRKGDIESVRFDDNPQLGELAIDLTSTGNAGVRLNGQYSIWHKDDFPGGQVTQSLRLGTADEKSSKVLQSGSLTVLPVLAGTRRTLKQSVPLPEMAGDFVLYVYGELGAEPFTKEFAFRKGQ